MCSHDDPSDTNDERAGEWPGEWETMDLAPEYILSHLTDAHCHPTDLSHDPGVYDGVALGGLASMATVPEDQGKVAELGSSRPWEGGSLRGKQSGRGPRVVSCFGYHPWFTHRYTLLPQSPGKEAHYNAVFFPQTGAADTARRKREKEVLGALIRHLPEPIPFGPILNRMRRDVVSAKEQGRLVMVGEVGLDGAARVLWPVSARGLYDEATRGLRLEGTPAENNDEWKRLTPLKISMQHQRAILTAQMELAIELAVPVSLHCVAAAGPTLDVLVHLRDTYGTRFTNSVNVDLHSAGGWSPAFWTSASKNLSNLYASPSIYITSRTRSAPDLIRAIPTDRMLVESDTHDVRLSTRLVWGAVDWIARCKRWEVESDLTPDWGEDGVVLSEDEWWRTGSSVDAEEGRVWAVRTLERNWARFMGLIQPYE
ncbi:hypothetical protein DB88DRAFT_439198 [Papiliotrema laurentii]|uniref:Metallo-dependent hydrolase n=1 Tax=Papiliotrema laurentii TaxID=5418 RepID=A0AAD9D0M6_PAPLA|nr:hypothetical protein DB88DRAFT_439198 [Papiliotrema laurentii]